MARSPQHLGGRSFLDQAPGVHHEQARGEYRHGGEVVADPHQAHAGFPDQSFHLDQDLRLYRHIQRGGRFVAYHQAWVVQERDRDRDALAHAARELVRISRQAPLRIRNADLGQRADRTPAHLRPVGPAVCLHRQLHLGQHRKHRVEGAHRVLEHHRDAATTQGPQLAARQADQFLAVQLHRSAGDAPGRIDQPEDRITRDALARAGFADQADDFARIDVERHAVHGPGHAGPGRKLGAEIAHPEQRLAHPAPTLLVAPLIA